MIKNQMAVKFTVISEFRLNRCTGITNKSTKLSIDASPLDALDLVVFQRVLNLSDVSRVQEWLGWRAAAGRWFMQVGLFASLHRYWGRVALERVRDRAAQNGCPLDRQLREAGELLLLWLAIAGLAAAHFAGAPIEDRLNLTYRRMRSALINAPSAILPQFAS